MWGVFVSITHCVLCGNFVNFVLHALCCFMLVVFILSDCLYKISILSRSIRQLPNWKTRRKEQRSLFCSQYLDWFDFRRGQLEFVSLCLPPQHLIAFRANWHQIIHHETNDLSVFSANRTANQVKNLVCLVWSIPVDKASDVSLLWCACDRKTVLSCAC